MKISKSKQELARIISENGGWREGGFATQNANGDVRGFDCKPIWMPKIGLWRCDGDFYQWFYHEPKVKNYFQITISRAEYFHLHPAPDADGWIEWNGGECPVGGGVVVDLKWSDGFERKAAKPEAFRWQHLDSRDNIIAYRLHKPNLAETEFCESVMRSIPEPSPKPTIEQMAADYRNLLDFAQRKLVEANDAKADSEAKLAELVAAGKVLGLVLSVAAPEPELVITDWRDLQVGDEIEVFNFECPEDESRRKQELMSGPCIVMQTEGGNVRIELKDNLPKRCPYWNATGVDACDFKFIRHP